MMPWLERNPSYHMNFCDICDMNLTGLPFWTVHAPAAVPNGYNEWHYDACDKCKDAFVQQHGDKATVTKRDPD